MKSVADILLETHEARILERSGKDLPLDDERCRPRERSTWERHRRQMAQQQARRAALRADKDALAREALRLHEAGWLTTAICQELGVTAPFLPKLLRNGRRRRGVE
jgi:hypothetical protein